VPLVLSFVKNLAEYEKLSHLVVATEQVIAEELFGPNSHTEALLGYSGIEPVAFAVYFHNFSTFLGKKGLYLEDLYVRQAFRRRGFGRAMLLEALGPALDRVNLPPVRQLEVICRLLATAWMVPPAASGRMAVPRDKATGLDGLVRRLWDELDEPCSPRVLEQALVFARRRADAFDPARTVQLHGDAATANALRVTSARPGAETGFVFVDPDGFLGDPAYDLGVALRDWGPELLASDDPSGLARHYCRLLAANSGVDEQEIWEWGFLERVSTGLYALAMGAGELSRPFFETAEALLT